MFCGHVARAARRDCLCSQFDLQLAYDVLCGAKMSCAAVAVAIVSCEAAPHTAKVRGILLRGTAVGWEKKVSQIWVQQVACTPTTHLQLDSLP